MKQRTKYSRRFLAVLLATLMLLAATQPISFVAAAGEDPDPVWGDGVASAYWDGETIRVDFPQASSAHNGIKYYADLIDLDEIDTAETHLRKVIAEGIPLQNETMALAEGGMLSAVIQRGQLGDQFVSGHRINVAITAVDRDGWRSQPVHAVVGDSVRVPEAGSAPDSSWQFKKFAFFSDDSGIGDEEAEMKYRNNGNSWPSGTGFDEYGMNFDGAKDYSGNQYRDAGFVDETSADKYGAATAYRFYVTDPNKENRTADIHWDYYTPPTEYYASLFGSYPKWGTSVGANGWNDIYNYTQAKELWIWVDMTNVRFEKLSFQVRPNDGGIIEWNKANIWDYDNSQAVFGKYEYSMVNYFNQMHQEAEIGYINSDGLWDTITTQNGYLRDFGNYRGYLRIPVNQLAGMSYTGYYDGVATNQSDFTETDESLSREWKTLDQAKLRLIDWDPDGEPNAQAPALNYITSVGFTWSNATEDSKEQSFYIDHIGFAGSGMTGSNRSALPYTTDSQENFQTLVAEKLPSNASLVNLSHKKTIEDLSAVAAACGYAKPQLLIAAEQELDQLMNGVGLTTLPVWLEQQVQSELTSEQLKPLYELYLTFTVDQLNQLGAAAEKKLLDAYNIVQKTELFPDALFSTSFKAFNTFEPSDNYRLGDKSYNLYEQSSPYNNSSMWKESPNYNDPNVKQSWEGIRKLTAYSLNNGLSLRYTFGLGNTTIGNHGFAGSQSVDTRLNRAKAGDASEKYRITFPYQGQHNVTSWDDLVSCSIAGASDLMFYIDFTDVENIRKLWITLVGSDGRSYSNANLSKDESGTIEYRFLDLSQGNSDWSDAIRVQNGGCFGNELSGKQGFIKIPLQYFSSGNPDNENPYNDSQATLTSTMTAIRQIRLQYTATDQGSKDNVGSHLIFDMFGFVGADGSDTFGNQYYAPHQTDNFVPAQDAEGTFQALFDQALALDGTAMTLLTNDLPAIDQALKAYYSLDAVGKAEMNRFLEAKGSSVEKICAVKINSESRGLGENSSVKGQLTQYIENTNASVAIVKTGFANKTALTDGQISNINSAFACYAGYPVKYQNTVATYWADRNLHAVYPNFTVTTPSTAEPQAPVAELSLQNGNYSGSVTLEYYAAVDPQHPIALKTDPAGQVILTAEDDSNQTIAVNLAGGLINPVNGNGKLIYTLSIRETDVTHAAAYSGSFRVKVELPAVDDGTAQASNPLQGGIENAAQYRIQEYTVYVKLIAGADYTVVIPADTEIPWGNTNTPMSGAEALGVKNLQIPSTAWIDVAMTNQGNLSKAGSAFQIPYQIQRDGTGDAFSDHTFAMNQQEQVALSVAVQQEDWKKVPIAQYQDTLTFTITYREQGETH